MSLDYVSSIPTAATERIVQTHPTGAKAQSEYWVRGQVVGQRTWDADGNLETETPLRDGVKHGLEYSWTLPGCLTFAEPFETGRPHGEARQWDYEGRRMGSYTMVQGTGIDLWRGERQDGSIYLAEVRYLLNGSWHGYEWWLNEDQRTVYIERHWSYHQLHGIERKWTDDGRLQRGFPKFHVRGKPVSPLQYLAHRQRHATLPAFNPADNRPERVFPKVIACFLSV